VGGGSQRRPTIGISTSANRASSRPNIQDSGESPAGSFGAGRAMRCAGSMRSGGAAEGSRVGSMRGFMCSTMCLCGYEAYK